VSLPHHAAERQHCLIFVVSRAYLSAARCLRKALSFVVAAVALTAYGVAYAAIPQPRLAEGVDGTTCDYFNFGASIAWRNRNGDWRDAAGTPQGNAAYDKKLLKNTDRGDLAGGLQLVEFDVSAVVAKPANLASGRLFLAVREIPEAGRTGVIELLSRESPRSEHRPALIVETGTGFQHSLHAVADTYGDCSTYTGLGAGPMLQAGRGRVVMLEFDLTALAKAVPFKSATLRLVRAATRYGDATLGVFILDIPRTNPSVQPTRGLAAQFDRDQGIDTHPDVFMATDFEATTWSRAWTSITSYFRIPNHSVVDSDPLPGFVPLSGRALRVRIPKGQNIGLDMRYEFAKTKWQSEPSEAYLRYYLRLGDDWYPKDGGKMPGFAGTYGRAGWGDRPVDGFNGWSARGSYGVPQYAANPYFGYTTLGSYATHPDTPAGLGTVWPWMRGLLGLVERNRWYCIEQQIRLNTPGRKDGILRVWIDGVLAFEETKVRFRDTDALKIEYVWMNVYHGGTAPAPQDLHLYIDNVVIARTYIGPMARR